MPVLPDAKKIDAHLKMSSQNEAIYKKAIDCNGACVKKFDQGDLSLAKGVGSIYQPRGWNGVCFAMSIQWIAAHANESDFWGWLYGESTINRNPSKNLDLGRARLICDFQGALYNRKQHGDLSTAKSRGLTSQGLAELWLKDDGVVKTSYGSKPVTPMGGGIVNALAPDKYAIGGCYKEFGMYGDDGGHSCAMWVGSDVTYFDPNFGEFWFQKAADFRKWFFHYWFTSKYQDDYETYEITAYSKVYKR